MRKRFVYYDYYFVLLLLLLLIPRIQQNANLARLYLLYPADCLCVGHGQLLKLVSNV